MDAELASLGTVGAEAEQPAAPPAPPAEAAVAAEAAVRAELAQRMQEAAARVAGHAPPGAATSPEGKVVITGRDGQTIVLDAGAVPQEQIDGYVHQALAPAPLPSEPGPPPDEVALVGVVMSLIALMVIGFPLARAWARRLDQRGAGASTPADVTQRLERIEQAVEAIAVEVERVSEGQRFSARLLSERLPDALPASGAERVPAVQGAREARPLVANG